MMNASILACRVGAALWGAAIWAGAAVAVRAADSVPPAPPPAHVAGVVAAATDTTLQIHTPFDGDVTLTLDATTQIQKDGDLPAEPDEPAGASSADTPPP